MASRAWRRPSGARGGYRFEVTEIDQVQARGEKKPSTVPDSESRPNKESGAEEADKPAIPATAYKAMQVRVYLTESHKIETVPLEEYVKGVVAAEMPLAFDSEALEAQALAARTYIVRRLWLHDRSGLSVAGADVTDTQTHQSIVPRKR